MAETARAAPSMPIGKPPLAQPRQAQSTKNIAKPVETLKLEVVFDDSKPEPEVVPEPVEEPVEQDSPPKKAKTGQPTQKKRKKTPKVRGKKKKEAEKVPLVEEGPPEQPKVPDAPPRKQCTRCS